VPGLVARGTVLNSKDRGSQVTPMSVARRFS
jgi:hypothetical protein